MKRTMRKHSPRPTCMRMRGEITTRFSRSREWVRVKASFKEVKFVLCLEERVGFENVAKGKVIPGRENSVSKGLRWERVVMSRKQRAVLCGRVVGWK